MKKGEISKEKKYETENKRSCNWYVLPATIAVTALICEWYYRLATYECPECHEVFKPSRKEFFFAFHTPRTRKLTCPNCGVKSYCREKLGK